MLFRTITSVKNKQQKFKLHSVTSVALMAQLLLYNFRKAVNHKLGVKSAKDVIQLEDEI